VSDADDVMCTCRDGQQQQQPSTRDLLQQAQREDFILEVSELLHRQLVTSALDSSWRQVLERQMRVSQ